MASNQDDKVEQETSKYSDEQIQFLQKLVKEQRDLEQQIKILKKACKQREGRKKQVDTTIIKYFKTNDISHVNLQSSNCRLECITTKTKTGLSQKYVTQMLNELLTDESLANEVLDYILSGRQTTEKVKLKTIENYKNKRLIKKRALPKTDKQFSTTDKTELIQKIKNQFANKPNQEIEPTPTTPIEEYDDTTNDITNDTTNDTEEYDDTTNDTQDTHDTNDTEEYDTPNDLKVNNQYCIDADNCLPIMYNQPVKTSNTEFINTDINNFIQNQINDINPLVKLSKHIPVGNSITNLASLYKDLMNRAQIAKNRIHTSN
jgi:hypothetical protein